MVVGVLHIRLRVHQSRSLKAKRHVIRKIKDKLKQHHNVVVSEVSAQDDWKNTVLGIVTVSADSAVVNATLEKAAHMIESLFLADILSKTVMIHQHKEEDLLHTFSNNTAPDHAKPSV